MKYYVNITTKIMVLVAVFVLMAMIPSSAQAEYRLEDFLILVDDQIIIRGAAEVFPGQGGIGAGAIPRRSDLGSRSFAEIGGRLRTFVPVGAPEASPVTDVAIIAPNVKLGNFATVSHVIYDAGTGSYDDAGTSGRIGPSVLEDSLGTNSLNSSGIADLPAFPTFPTFTAGAVDVVVPGNDVVNLPPGSYRDLLIGFRATVNFSSGVYDFRRIIARTAGSYNLIMLDDFIQINVKEFVRLAEFGNFNPTRQDDIILYVEGIDASYGGANRNQNGVGPNPITGVGPDPAPAAFQYDGDGQFNACFVFVKNGTINLRGNSGPPNWATMWFGRAFHQFSSLRIKLEHPGTVCFEEPGIDCACITNFTLRSDGTLKIDGINFSADTVERVAIFTETAAATLGSVTGGDAGQDQLFADLTSVTSGTIITQDVQSLLPSGDDFFLGIIYPVNTTTGNTGGYCIFTDKALEIP